MKNKQIAQGRRSRKQIPRQLPYRPEINYFDVIESAGVSMSLAGSIDGLADIPAGDVDQTRNGNLITYHSNELRVSIARNGADAFFRIILAQLKYDQQTSTVNDPIESVGTNAAMTAAYNRDFVAPMAQASRMKILWDHRGFVDTYHPQVVLHHRTDSLPLKYARYLESGANNVSVDGGLVLFWYSTVAANQPVMVYYNRVEYLDS